MSTRRLILAALACGLAILVAGAAMLIRVSSTQGDAAEVLAVGARGVVNDVGVTLVSAGATLRVRIEVPTNRVELKQPAQRFSLLRGGQRIDAVDAVDVPDAASGEPDLCSAVDRLAAGDVVECDLAFAAQQSPGSSYLRFTLDDQAIVWLVPQ